MLAAARYRMRRTVLMLQCYWRRLQSIRRVVEMRRIRAATRVQRQWRLRAGRRFRKILTFILSNAARKISRWIRRIWLQLQAWVNWHFQSNHNPRFLQ